MTDWLKQRDEVVSRLRRGSIERAEVESILLDLTAPAAAGSAPHAAMLLEILDASPILRSSIHSILLSHADVEDALQETLLAIAHSLGSFRGESSVLAWAAGIARNKARDIRRRKGRPVAPDPVVNLPTEVDRFTSQWASRADVDAALAGLSDKLRPVFELADIEGFSYNEIATQLDLERNTVASRLRRARAQLGLSLTTNQS